MNILFYTPLNIRCRDIESQAGEFVRNGHSIFLLTLGPRAVLHDNFAGHGYQVDSTESSSRFIYVNLVRRLWKFVTYCRKNRIDVVYAHLEPANFIAVLGQYFLSSRIIVCRHHTDFAKLSGFSNDLSYRLTYRLAKDVIVVSRRAKEYMIREEGIRVGKIHHINLAYDFSLYAPADKQMVRAIEEQYKADVLLLTVGRLNELKRPGMSIQLVSELVQAGLDVKLLVLGGGDLFNDLKAQADSLGLSDRVFVLGHVINVLDYMTAASFLVHPSISESSCITVQEAGLAGLPPIVCRGVGDFDDYIEDRQNGLIVGKDTFVKEATVIIQDFVKDKTKYTLMGEKLRATVYARFDIRITAPYYEQTFHRLR